jgi:hypothetical protein
MHTADGNYDLKDDESGRFGLLSELFDICDGIYISIDLKDSSAEMVDRVDELIKRYKREQYTIWGSMFADQHRLV